MTDRFDKLEGEKKQGRASGANEEPNRFDYLEIIGRENVPAAAPSSNRVLCPHCGQPNEAERQSCWACYRPLAAKGAAPAQEDELALVIDGLTYRSSDARLPEDVRDLMNVIRKNGYSPQVVADWQRRRARPDPDSTVPCENKGEIEEGGVSIRLFKGARVSVLRVGEKIYTSDDRNLSPELREIFAYVEENGVTAAVMERVRLACRRDA